MKTNDILQKETISFKEVRLLLRRMNNGEQIDLTVVWDEPKRLEDPDQGIKYLMGRWKTPKGVERKNNPFGYREVDILEDFSHFEFAGTYDTGNRYFSYNVPLWNVVANHGGSFQYYMKGGEIHIVW